MATVWAAEDPLLARRVAVKTLDPTSPRTRHPRPLPPRGRRRRRLSPPEHRRHLRHRRGRRHRVHRDGARRGPTLRQAIDLHGRLPGRRRDPHRRAGRRRARRRAPRRARAPRREAGNVLVPPTGPVKVTDFGIAKAAGGRGPHPRRQRDGHRALPRARAARGPPDRRARRRVLARPRCSTRCSPATRRSAATPRSAPRWRASPPPRPPCARERPEVPPALDDVVDRCLAREPRPASERGGGARRGLDRGPPRPHRRDPAPGRAARPAHAVATAGAPRPHPGPTHPQPLPAPSPPTAPSPTASGCPGCGSC